MTLSIVGGNGTDSALETTSGTQIFLYNEGGVIVGRVGTEVGAGTDTANPAGAVAFAISINNAGQATVAQYLSLEHPSAPNNYDEPINLAGKLDAVVTVTDGDGDVATDSVAIGAAISFEDDGPVANITALEAAATVDELIGQRPANSAADADANDSADDNVAANPFLAGYGIRYRPGANGLRVDGGFAAG